MMGIPPSAVDGGINGRSVTFIQFTGPGAVPANLTSRAEAKALGEKLMSSCRTTRHRSTEILITPI
jgi:hypothetical protein